jgi:hypothetical protein
MNLKKINNSMKRIGVRLLRLSLYLFYAVFRRRIQLLWISSPDPIIFLGNSFTMRWQLSGCYKIEVNNKVILPGTTNFVQLDPQQTEKSLHLTFYGYKARIEREYDLQIVDSPLKKNIALLLECKRLATPQIFERLLNLRIKNLCNVRCPVSIRTLAIKLLSHLLAPKAANIPHIDIKLEPFNPQ